MAPIQLAIRLLIPEGSKLLELDEVRGLIAGFDSATLTYRWSHAEPRVDELQREVSALVGVRVGGDRHAVFDAISALAHARAGIPQQEKAPRAGGRHPAVPYLSEPWYCCAEPNAEQVALV